MHFVAHSARFPYLRFNVPELKRFREAQGILAPSTWVRFNAGFLDTKAENFTEQEAAYVAEALKKVHAAAIRLEFTEDGATQKIVPQKPITIKKENQ